MVTSSKRYAVKDLDVPVDNVVVARLADIANLLQCVASDMVTGDNGT